MARKYIRKHPAASCLYCKNQVLSKTGIVRCGVKGIEKMKSCPYEWNGEGEKVGSRPKYVRTKRGWSIG